MSRTAKLDAELLAGVRREVDRLRAVHPSEVPLDRTGAGQLRAAVTDARTGIVVADFAALLGRALSDADLKACQRAAASLEAAGQLERLRLGYSGVRVTHLRLIEPAT